MSDEVKRYDISGNSWDDSTELLECEAGDYVLFSDYESERQSHAETKKELKKYEDAFDRERERSLDLERRLKALQKSIAKVMCKSDLPVDGQKMEIESFKLSQYEELESDPIIQVAVQKGFDSLLEEAKEKSSQPTNVINVIPPRILKFGEDCPKYFPLPTKTDQAGHNCKKYCNYCMDIITADEMGQVVVCGYTK